MKIIGFVVFFHPCLSMMGDSCCALRNFDLLRLRPKKKSVRYSWHDRISVITLFYSYR